jgi:hypothetical protein
MSIPVSLRGDFKASQVRALARKTKDGPQARRLLALAAIYDGATRQPAEQVPRSWNNCSSSPVCTRMADGLISTETMMAALNDTYRATAVCIEVMGEFTHDFVRVLMLLVDQSGKIALG